LPKEFVGFIRFCRKLLARFFCSGIPVGKAQILAPSSRPDFYDYIFDGGCIATDSQFAAVFWMLDSD
jgi:hypothetical protein